MNMCTIDGVVHFAKWHIKIENPLSDYPKEGVFCYSEEEKKKYIQRFTNERMKFSINELPPVDKTMRGKTKGIKYKNKTEALRHIQQDICPDSLVVPRLLERVKMSEERELLLQEKLSRFEEKEKDLVDRLEETIKNVDELKRVKNDVPNTR